MPLRYGAGASWVASLITTASYLIYEQYHNAQKTMSTFQPSPLPKISTATLEFSAPRTVYPEPNVTISAPPSKITSYTNLIEPATLPTGDAGAATPLTIFFSVLPLLFELLRSLTSSTLSSAPQNPDSRPARRFLNILRIVLTEAIPVLLQQAGQYFGFLDLTHQNVLVTTLVLGMWTSYRRQQRQNARLQNDLWKQQEQHVQAQDDLQKQIVQLQLLVESQGAKFNTHTNQTVAPEADTTPQLSHTFASLAALDLLSHDLSAKLEALSTQINDLRELTHVAADEAQKFKASQASTEDNTSRQLEALSTRLSNLEKLTLTSPDEVQKLIKASEATVRNNTSQLYATKVEVANDTRKLVEAHIQNLGKQFRDLRADDLHAVDNLRKTFEDHRNATANKQAQSTASLNGANNRLENLTKTIKTYQDSQDHKMTEMATGLARNTDDFGRLHTRLEDSLAQLRELKTSCSDRTTQLKGDLTGLQEGITELTDHVCDLYESDRKLGSKLRSLEANITTIDKDGLLLQEHLAHSEAASSSSQRPEHSQNPENSQLDSETLTPPNDGLPGPSSDGRPPIIGVGASKYAASEPDASGTGQGLGATESRDGQTSVNDNPLRKPKHKRGERGGKQPKRCLFHVQGFCKRGDDCDRRHDDPTAEGKWEEPPSPSTPAATTAEPPSGFEAFKAKARFVAKD